MLPDGSPPPIPEKIYQMAFRMRQVGRPVEALCGGFRGQVAARDSL